MTLTWPGTDRGVGGVDEARVYRAARDMSQHVGDARLLADDVLVHRVGDLRGRVW